MRLRNARNAAASRLKSCGEKPMYRVQYFCPRQSPYWQESQNAYSDFETAAWWCELVKPPQGMARVIDPYGQEVYRL